MNIRTPIKSTPTIKNSSKVSRLYALYMITDIPFHKPMQLKDVQDIYHQSIYYEALRTGTPTLETYSRLNHNRCTIDAISQYKALKNEVRTFL